MQYLKPKSVTGLDFSEKAVDFCKKHYSVWGLSFNVGNAESIPFKDEKFDVIINIESSHCYSNMDCFLSGVSRILKPNGYFLFADFRGKGKINSLRRQLKNSGLNLLKEKKITKNVLKSLDLDNERKSELIIKKTLKLFRKSFFDFAAIKGSEVYESFKTGEREYFSFVLQKII